MRRILTWLYWRFCYQQDAHNRDLVLIVVQNEPTPDMASVIVTEVERAATGEATGFSQEAIKVYSGRGKLLRLV